MLRAGGSSGGMLQWRVGECGSAPTANQPEGTPGTISIFEKDIRYIFRDAPGHLADDTPANRQALNNTASNPNNYLGIDKYGNKWCAETRPDGTQVWARVRKGLIINGGVNPTPRPYNPQTGLNDPPTQ